MEPIQCKLARTALGLGIRDLATLCKVSPNTIARFERGEGLRPATVEKIRTVLEQAGITLIEENKSGLGIRLKSKS